MNAATSQALIGQVASELSQLPEEDLALVAEFVDYLIYRRQKVHPPRRAVVDIRTEAKQRSRLLGSVPRSEIVARFQRVSEEIRQEAISQGTSIEGDQMSD